LTFTQAGEKFGDDDNGRSLMPTNDRAKFGAERLDPMITEDVNMVGRFPIPLYWPGRGW